MKNVKKYDDWINETVNINNMTFLGYHSSRTPLRDGYHPTKLLDENSYADLIRDMYLEIISGGDKNIETNNIKAMNKVFAKKKYGFTFVSDEPIKASSFQRDKYKYGDYLFKVYGDGNEILLDDPNEIKATIVVSKKPLYFVSVENED